MISLLAVFILFLTAGLVIMQRLLSPRKEVWVFAAITGIGFIMWGSIVLSKPLDLNKAIGWIIQSMF